MATHCRDRRAWWAAVCGVAQSRTRLKRLSSSSNSTKTRQQSCYSYFSLILPSPFFPSSLLSFLPSFLFLFYFPEKRKLSKIHHFSLLLYINQGLLLLLLLLCRFSRVWLCATPQTAAHQALPSPGFSRQEHWSGLPFPSPMDESEKWKWSRSVVSDS